MGPGEVGVWVACGRKGTSGHWAVGRKGAAEVGLVPALAVMRTPALFAAAKLSLGQERLMLLFGLHNTSQIQTRAAGRGLLLCPGSSAQCAAMGTRAQGP